MKRFRILVRATCLRQTKATIGTSCHLPERGCRIEELAFSAEEQQLHDFFAERCQQLARGRGKTNSGSLQDGPNGKRNILTLIQFLRQVCDHGQNLLPSSALDAWRARDDTPIGWSTMYRCSKICRVCDTVDDELSMSPSEFNVDQDWVCSDCSNAAEENQLSPNDADSVASTSQTNATGALTRAFVPSTKVMALLKNLRATREVQIGNEVSRVAKRSVTLWLPSDVSASKN